MTWTYTNCNIGNVVLSDIELIDDNGTPENRGDDFVVCTLGDLWPDEKATCRLQGIAAIGLYGNAGTVVANSPLQVSELSSDRSHYVSFIWLYLPLKN